VTERPSTQDFIVKCLILLFVFWGVLFPATWGVLTLLDREVPLAIILVSVGLVNFVLGFFGGRQIKV
jgi:hypothetical protein